MRGFKLTCLLMFSMNCVPKQTVLPPNNQEARTGNARLRSAASVTGLTEVVCVIDGDGMTPLTVNIPVVDDKVEALIEAIPAGPARRFSVTARRGVEVVCDGQGVVDILATQTAELTIVLQCETPPEDRGAASIDGAFNFAPALHFATASRAQIETGEDVLLYVEASDPDGDPLEYQWNAPSGVFTSATSAATTWTAPLIAGLYAIEVSVSDDRGASTGLTLQISVTPSQHRIAVTVSNLLGTGLRLSNNVGDELEIPAGIVTPFPFALAVNEGQAYAVDVISQPTQPRQNCETTTLASGTASGDVTVQVECTTNSYAVNAHVTGASAAILTQLNALGAQVLTNGTTLLGTLLDQQSFAFTVPSSCFAQPASGLMDGAPITIEVECTLPGITALYPTHANWNDYVANDGADVFSASDANCAAAADAGSRACLHAGEMKKVIYAATNSCAGVEASDSLNAFLWRCVERPSDVLLVSRQLRDDKSLADLVDFDLATWRSMVVTITRLGDVVVQTPPAPIASNPLVVSNASTTLGTSGTVYIFRADPAAAKVVAADRVGVIVRPGITWTGSAANGEHLVNIGNRRFAWVEGAFDVAGDASAVSVTGAAFSQLRRITGAGPSDATVVGSQFHSSKVIGLVSRSGQYGVRLTDSRGTELRHLQLDSAFAGMDLSSVSRMRVSDVSEANMSYGFHSSIFSGSGNVFDSWRAASTQAHTEIAGGGNSNNVFINMVSLGMERGGFGAGGCNNCFLSNITTLSSLGGTGAGSGREFNSVINIAQVTGNLRTFAWWFDNTSFHTHDDGALFTLSSSTFDFPGSGGMFFRGLLKLNTPTCTGGSATAGLNVDCSPSAASTATRELGLSVASSFVGPVASDSAAPFSSGNGSEGAFATITNWHAVENQYRGIVKHGVAATAETITGRCSTGNTCQVWDASLRASDTTLRNALSAPIASDVGTHYWSAADATTCAAIPGATWRTACSLPGYANQTTCTAATGTWSDRCVGIYLRHALEVLDDDLGNDNGLCESHETCIVTPNLGAYQGHGVLLADSVIPLGTGEEIEDVRLVRWSQNGR